MEEIIGEFRNNLGSWIWFAIVLLICFCVTKCPNTLQLKTASIYYLTDFLRIRNIREAWLDGSGSGSPVRLQSVSKGFSHVKAQLGLENQLPSTLMWFLAGFRSSLVIVRRSLFLPYVNLFIGLLTSWQLASSRVRDPRQNENQNECT